MKTIYSLCFVIGILFVLHLHAEIVQAATQSVTVLKGGQRIGVVSMNLDTRCSNSGRGQSEGCKGSVSLKDAINNSLQEGRLWDIIGFQEMDEPHSQDIPGKSTYSDTADFIRIMKELGKTYSCVKQKEYSDDFYVAICSAYPFIEGTLKEFVIHRQPSGTQARVVICAQVNSPAGILTICDTHIRAKSPEPAQFRTAEEYIFNTVLSSYIPPNINQASRDLFMKSLRARLIITGDMNTDVKNIIGKFMTACVGPGPVGSEGCGIDQVMNTNMSFPGFGHTTPFTTQYLVSNGGYRDVSKRWPTDHKGPVLTTFTTRELTIPIQYNDAQVASTPTVSVITPTNAISTIRPEISATNPTIQASPTVIASAPTSSIPIKEAVQQELQQQRKVSFSFLDWILSHGPIVLNNLQELDQVIQTKVSTIFP